MLNISMESRGFFVAKASRVGHSDTSGDLTVSSSPFDCAAGDTGIQVSAVIHSIHLHTFHDAQQEVI